MSAEAIAIPDVGDIVGEGRFELGRKLGEGGMSNVFVARDRFLDRDVALKLLIPRYLGRSEREQRFLNEAEYLRRVQDHVNVTRLIDAGRLRDRNHWPWLSTEIMSGKTLDVIRRSLDIHRILEIARQLAEALRACHEAGVVHRDLTPSNVFVLDDGSVKLFDFSHAADLRGPKLAIGAPERLTRVFETPGTVGYIAPDQAANAAPAACMDSYSYGVLLYEVVSGLHPFKQFTDRDAFIQAQVDGSLESPRLQAWAYDAPEELAELVRDCMQRDGSQRPTMREVLERLEAITAAMRQGNDDGDATAVMDPVVLPAAETSEDVTMAMDAPAMIAGRRSKQEADPAMIGAWAPRGPAAVVSLEQAHAEDRTVFMPVAAAVPREQAPTVQEDRTAELAFARPPQLREAAAMPSLLVGADLAAPPEVRQPDGESSSGIDPEFFSTGSGAAIAEEVEPASIGPSHARMVGLLLGLGLVVMLLSWVAYSKLSGPAVDPEKKIDGERDRSAASQHDPEAAAESGGASLEGEPGAADSDAVGETGGTEIVPEVEIDPQPKPKNGKSKNGTPKDGTSEHGKPKNGNDPAGDSGSHTPEAADLTKSPECAGVEDEARAAYKNRKWSGVVKLTDRKGCWTSSNERIRLRVEALFGLGDWSTCVAVGDASTDAKVRSFVEKCKTAAKLSEPETP